LNLNAPIPDHFWFFKEDRSPWDSYVLNYIDRKGLEGFHETLTLWGLGGVMDFSAPRDQRVLYPASKEAVLEWARTHGLEILGDPEKFQVLSDLIDQENEILKQEAQVRKQFEDERFRQENAFVLNKASEFKESISKLPASKEENLEIIKKIVGVDAQLGELNE
jgi:hypothetical protein